MRHLLVLISLSSLICTFTFARPQYKEDDTDYRFYEDDSNGVVIDRVIEPRGKHGSHHHHHHHHQHHQHQHQKHHQHIQHEENDLDELNPQDLSSDELITKPYLRTNRLPGLSPISPNATMQGSAGDRFTLTHSCI
uniref:Secreted protein n=1 Tax=Heterorhabditis bacteriophora TaxID=37862 RepID=A0A1I7WND2_HETBA